MCSTSPSYLANVLSAVQLVGRKETVDFEDLPPDYQLPLSCKCLFLDMKGPLPSSLDMRECRSFRSNDAQSSAQVELASSLIVQSFCSTLEANSWPRAIPCPARRERPCRKDPTGKHREPLRGKGRNQKMVLILQSPVGLFIRPSGTFGVCVGVAPRRSCILHETTLRQHHDRLPSPTPRALRRKLVPVPGD